MLIVTVFDFLLKQLERYLDVTQRRPLGKVDEQLLALAQRGVTPLARPAAQSTASTSAFNQPVPPPQRADAANGRSGHRTKPGHP